MGVFMHNRGLQDTVESEIIPIAKAMDFILVEVLVGRNRNKVVIKVVIYKRDGVGIEDCACLSRNIQPRLELIDELDDYLLEVTSPGITRMFKSNQEFEIFTGKRVLILKAEDNKWFEGIIDHVSEKSVFIKNNDTIKRIDFNKILKAKLNDVREAEK